MLYKYNYVSKCEGKYLNGCDDEWVVKRCINSENNSVGIKDDEGDIHSIGYIVKAKYIFEPELDEFYIRFNYKLNIDIEPTSLCLSLSGQGFCIVVLNFELKKTDEDEYYSWDWDWDWDM